MAPASDRNVLVLIQAVLEKAERPLTVAEITERVNKTTEGQTRPFAEKLVKMQLESMDGIESYYGAKR